MSCIKNSYFDQDIKNKKILVLVPHQDDEINIAGSLIYDLVKRKADINICFSTNGDYDYKAETRQKEVFNGLRILGVSKEKIYFLGYSDTYIAETKHIYTNKNDEIFISNTGKKETYCNDYAYKIKGRHSSYTKKNYLTDIELVIKKIKPDVIICIDFDLHPDHRALSLGFETVIGKVLKDDIGYKPIVYKSFAYSVYYNGPKDYVGINLKETKYINRGKKEDLIGKSIYKWDERIRVPVRQCCRTVLLSDNILYKVMNEYKSQYAMDRIERIANSDIVYWQRRTDNLAYLAEIFVSSNDLKKSLLIDFKLYDSKQITKEKFSFEDYLWIPSDNDDEKVVQFSWNNKVSVKQINLYSSLSEKSSNVKIKVILDDITEIEKNLIFKNGEVQKIIFDNKQYISNLKIKILEAEKNFGFSEIEILENSKTDTYFKNYFKITIDDNFAYKYFIDKNLKKIPLGIYGYDKDKIKFEVIYGDANFKGMNLILGSSDKIKIRATSIEDNFLYDELIIERINLIKKFKILFSQYYDLLKIKIKRKILKKKVKKLLKKKLI